MTPIAKINLVATWQPNDPKSLYDMCGSKNYHKFLDKQFKNNDSNFEIAVVVDVWVTGFDVPSLAIIYIDKPIQKHNLIQTIFHVKRVFEGNDKGLVVDYIGIRNSLLDAMKSQGESGRNPIEDIKITIGIFRELLAAIDKLLTDFDDTKFYSGDSLEKLTCLNYAAEYVQSKEDRQTNFMNFTRALRPAFDICSPSGELTEEESAKAQFYLIVRSTINEQTTGDAPDAEAMNEKVERIVQDALSCTGIENILSKLKVDDLASKEFRKELAAVKMPITKLNYLLKLLKVEIGKYKKINKIKAIEFDKRLQAVVDKYNNRDNLVFTNGVMFDVVNNLSEELLKIHNVLVKEIQSPERMGISVEEKVFYDILVKVRDTHGFAYEDEKCIFLAKEIKKLVDEKSKIAHWTTQQDIKSDLEMNLTVLLYNNKYPDTWTKEIFEKIMEQEEG
ncbi:MAG: DUF3387 domain-containing protein [Phascolarctobacterium sp.]|nr:DUF3387 domain-containing protein [Phascolarctobacterium sp.]